MANKHMDPTRKVGETGFEMTFGEFLFIIFAVVLVVVIIIAGSRIAARVEIEAISPAAQESLIHSIQFIKDNGNDEQLASIKEVVENSKERGFFSEEDYREVLIVHENVKFYLDNKSTKDRNSRAIERAIAILEDP